MLLSLFLVPNQGIFGMSRLKWSITTVFWSLEADLVPTIFWNFKAWGQECRQGQLCPGGDRGMRQRDRGDVVGRNHLRGPGLSARLWPTLMEVTRCFWALVCPLRNGRVALGSLRDLVLEEKSKERQSRTRDPSLDLE